jgi:hypothetical protein
MGTKSSDSQKDESNRIGSSLLLLEPAAGENASAVVGSGWWLKTQFGVLSIFK